MQNLGTWWHPSCALCFFHVFVLQRHGKPSFSCRIQTNLELFPKVTARSGIRNNILPADLRQTLSFCQDANNACFSCRGVEAPCSPAQSRRTRLHSAISETVLTSNHMVLYASVVPPQLLPSREILHRPRTPSFLSNFLRGGPASLVDLHPVLYSCSSHLVPLSAPRPSSWDFLPERTKDSSLQCAEHETQSDKTSWRVECSVL